MIITAAGAANLQTAPISVDGFLIGGEDPDVRLTYTGLTGWWEGSPFRDRIADRAGGDGGYDARPYRSPRTIVVTGQARADRRGLVAAMLQRLAAIQSDGALGLFTVDDPDLGVLSARVRPTGTPQTDASQLGAGFARWQVAFKSADWRKYAASVALTAGLRTQGEGLTYPLVYPLTYGAAGSGGRVEFTNSGTAATEPVITVSGPLAAGFEVTHVETGRRLRYVAPVGSDIVLDCGEGTCTSQGQERAANLVVREWFSVAAGATATFALATLGGETAASAPTVAMSVQLASAYT